MSDNQQSNIAEAFAAFSISDQKTLDRIFSEYPDMQNKFFDLASRKEAALKAGNDESLQAIIAEEKALVETALNDAVGK